jgi:hypothetical protein
MHREVSAAWALRVRFGLESSHVAYDAVGPSWAMFGLMQRSKTDWLSDAVPLSHRPR